MQKTLDRIFGKTPGILNRTATKWQTNPITGISAPTGTGFVETTSGAFNAAATPFAQAANQVSSFNVTGLTVPLASAFTVRNGNAGGTTTFTDKSDRLQITTSTTVGFTGGTQASISPPYTIDAATVLSGTADGSHSFIWGIALSDGTKYRAWLLGGSNGTYNLRLITYATVSTAGALVTTPAATPTFCPFMRLTDDGANRVVYISQNGKDFAQIFTEATNTGVTPTTFGICLANDVNPGKNKGSYVHYLVTNSVLGDAP